MSTAEVSRVRPFSVVSAVTVLHRSGDTATVAVALDGAWSAAGKLNGGYLTAVLARAAAAVSDHPHPVAASTHYGRSPRPGPAEVTVQVLRRGRTATQVRAQLHQDGAPLVEATFTLAVLVGPDGAGPRWDRGALRRPDLPFSAAHAFRPPAELFHVALLDQVELRLDGPSVASASGTPGGEGRLDGWLTLPAGESLDPVSLQLAVDVMPPATFDIRFTGWVPTQQLTTYVRALPAPGPVQLHHAAHLVDDGRVDETCHVWDSTGRLVAHSTQLALVDLPADA